MHDFVIPAATVALSVVLGAHLFNLLKSIFAGGSANDFVLPEAMRLSLIHI